MALSLTVTASGVSNTPPLTEPSCLGTGAIDLETGTNVEGEGSANVCQGRALFVVISKDKLVSDSRTLGCFKHGKLEANSGHNSSLNSGN